MHCPTQIKLIVALSSLLIGCGPRSNPGVDKPLPPLELSGLDGTPWNAADARGRVQVIDVWASWCKPCRKGFPILNRLARQHPRVAFVAVSLDEEASAVRDFLAQVPIEFPVVLDPEQTTSEKPWSVTRVPTLLVVDRSGIVRHRLEEPSDADYAELGRVLDQLQSPATRHAKTGKAPHALRHPYPRSAGSSPP